tara:strand:+ start:1814 stop:3631 length:1818 start_codon:yes stop_codon:yes gene_type:complete
MKEKSYKNLNLNITDPHSYADPGKAALKNLKLDLEANFEKNILFGSAILNLYCLNADTIKLDTDDLIIKRVFTESSKNETDLNFEFGKIDSILGTELLVFPKEKITGNYTIHIDYETSPEARALQWLKPEQTNGKTKPFLFTQSQAILARSWIPIQDGPGIRFCYTAKIKVPKGMMALMSATNPKELSHNGIYEFEMKQPIPAYLMALAIGDLSFKATGHRTGVYSEPKILEAAAWEFGETEKMVTEAEMLYGPYKWERYDLLVLPPSFPFGGMENPRLTFLTPTVISGDRSLVALIAHELAHSWSGNLVTNATWNDFWLNEGFTVYFENRIMEAVYGKDYSDMLRKLSYSELYSEVQEFMIAKPNETKLGINLAGRNPDDGLTTIAYDKGFHFLLLLENIVGREKFDSFLKDYFKFFQFKSITTNEFVKYLRSNLIDDDQWNSANIEEWIFGVGLPSNCPTVNPKRFKVVNEVVNNFIIDESYEFESKSWSTHEWLYFLDLLKKNRITLKNIEELEKRFHFTYVKNSEIFSAWATLVIPKSYQNNNFDNEVSGFLRRVGRRKFLTPIYRALINSGKKTFAQEIYSEARSGYHSVSQETLDDLMN